MITKIELPIDCQLYVQSYDLEDLIKVISPVKIHGYISDDDAKDLQNESKMVRIDVRICQTTKTSK